MRDAGGIYAYGTGHLRETLLRAAQLRDLDIQLAPEQADLIFLAGDVLDHQHDGVGSALVSVAGDLQQAVRQRASAEVPIVVVSQVPPGWTGRAAAGVPNIFYQVDTIIMSRAIERMLYPAQFVVGCPNPREPLPLAYQGYLAAHEAPVLQMSYESAELAKCAINYALAKQVEMANDLAYAAARCGADYADVRLALQGDARIGPLAYLRPGAPNQHLNRDVRTIADLLVGRG